MYSRQPQLVYAPFNDILNPPNEQNENPKECRICHEAFPEEWMARRCKAQGVPTLRYHTYDVLQMDRRAKCLLLVRYVRIHHGLGVKCLAEGPCPHDVSYAGHRFFPRDFGLDRAWISALQENLFEYQLIMKAYRRIATLSDMWGVIQDTGPASLYLVGPNIEEEWEQLWQVYDDLQPRVRTKGQRRFRITQAR